MSWLKICAHDIDATARKGMILRLFVTLPVKYYGYGEHLVLLLSHEVVP